jgi:hypothetical protein
LNLWSPYFSASWNMTRRFRLFFFILKIMSTDFGSFRLFCGNQVIHKTGKFPWFCTDFSVEKSVEKVQNLCSSPIEMGFYVNNDTSQRFF